MQFEVIDFIKYLSNSKYLKDYLIQEGYFLFYDVTFFTKKKNNNIIQFLFQITNEAVENIDKVLLIIYKYIEIMKSKGYEKKYFEDFIKLKRRNKQILEFNKNAFKDINSFLESKIRNYRLYGKNQIFTDGTPAIENYNENKIKELLNKFKYEKSFFGLNSYAKFTEYQTKTFLESTEIKTLKYYKSQYLYGKMPDNFKTRIEQYNNENIKIRDLSKYCSEKYESVVPCYKDKSKNCTELNEFDYLKEDEYNPTKLEEENSDYITYYQIDKSSESHKVHSYIEINLINEAQYIGLIKSYIELKISEINELNNIIVATPNLDCVSLEITSFSDNTELLINCLLNLLISELNQNDLDLLESNLIYTNMERLELSLSHYTINLFAQFMKGQKAENNLDLIIKQIHEVMNLFKSYYNEYFIKSIDYIDFKIAGNINKELVQNIHNSIKTKLPSVQHNNFILKQPKLINDNESYIINYYQKSEKIDEPDNAILVMYQYESKYARILQILASCFKMEAIPLLRFNFSNAYSPGISFDDGYFFLFEQGEYKEVDGMEDDINQVFYMLVNGELKCPNYDNIVKSFSLKNNGKVDRDDNYLFDKFKKMASLNENKKELNQDNIEIPKTFEELVEIVSPIFIKPKRFTFLVVRPGISDEDFQKLISKRKENYKYKPNEAIVVEHTDDIAYWVNRNS